MYDVLPKCLRKRTHTFDGPTPEEMPIFQRKVLRQLQREKALLDAAQAEQEKQALVATKRNELEEKGKEKQETRNSGSSKGDRQEDESTEKAATGGRSEDKPTTAEQEKESKVELEVPPEKTSETTENAANNMSKDEKAKPTTAAGGETATTADKHTVEVDPPGDSTGAKDDEAKLKELDAELKRLQAKKKALFDQLKRVINEEDAAKGKGQDKTKRRQKAPPPKPSPVAEQEQVR